MDERHLPLALENPGQCQEFLGNSGPTSGYGPLLRPFVYASPCDMVPFHDPLCMLLIVTVRWLMLVRGFVRQTFQNENWMEGEQNTSEYNYDHCKFGWTTLLKQRQQLSPSKYTFSSCLRAKIFFPLFENTLINISTSKPVQQTAKPHSILVFNLLTDRDKCK